MKLEKSVSLEIDGNNIDGTFSLLKIETSCGVDEATLYICQFLDSESKDIHVKFSRSDLEQFVEALKQVL